MSIQKLLDSHTTTVASEVGRSRTTPGAALAYLRGDRCEVLVSGSRVLLPDVEPVTTDTRWDLASLTKLYTATLVAIAVERGLVSWSTPMTDLVEWPGDATATLLDVVEHVSGLPAWERFYDDLPLNPDEAQARAAREQITARILAREHSVLGTHTYSDLGYLLLGFLLEDWFDMSLAETVVREISDPLNLPSTRYAATNPQPFVESAATEWCSRRGRWIRGTVHDENCDVVGGVAGHAGIFGTVQDVLAFGEAMLDIWRGRDGILKASTLHELWGGREMSGHHLGGWDTPSGPSSSVGTRFPRGSTFGHLGFTGTSLWIETSTETVVALLTNRVHPSRENARIKAMRIAVHDAVWDELNPS